MKKIVELLIVFLLCTSIIKAQDESVGQLITKCKSQKEDTVKISLLNKISSALITINPDTSYILCNQALSIANELLKSSNKEIYPHAKKGMGESYRLLGWYFEIKGDLNYSLQHYQLSISIWDDLLSSNATHLIHTASMSKARTLGNIGVVYSLKADYPKALDLYFQALKIYNKLNELKGIARINGNIGIAFKEQGELTKAQEYFSKALNMYEKLDFQPGIAHQIGNIGIVYYDQRNFVKALECYNKVLTIAKELGDLKMQADIIGNIGAVKYSLKDYDSAQEAYESALKLAEQLGHDHSKSIQLANIGNLYYQKGNFKQAINYLSSSLKYAYETNSLDLIRFQEAHIADTYQQLGQYDLALIHFKKHISARDSISNEENHKQQMRSEMNYEFEKKEAVLKEQQEKERILANEKSRFQRIVITTVTLGLLLVAVFSLFVLKTLKKTRLQKHIIEEKQKEILDSIFYARRIQRALITNEKTISKSLQRLRNRD